MLDLNSFVADPLVLFALGVAGLVAFVFGYFLSRKTREPTWAWYSANLMAGLTTQYAGLTVRFGDTTIDSFSVSKVAFWNDGRETIDASDMAKPVVITMPQTVRLLGCDVIYRTAEVTKFTASIRPGEGRVVEIGFEFLDKGQGGVVQIIHDGPANPALTVGGYIKGAGEPRGSSPAVYGRRANLLFFGGLFGGFAAFYGAGNTTLKAALGSEWDQVLAWVGGGLILVGYLVTFAGKSELASDSEGHTEGPAPAAVEGNQAEAGRVPGAPKDPRERV